MGQQVYFAAEGIFNKSNNKCLAWDQVPHCGKKEQKSALDIVHLASLANIFFPSLTPFFAFFPHCGAWFQAT